jgi:hypothetical protein
MAPTVPTKKHGFDPKKFLATIGEGRKVLTLRSKRPVFAQGDAANTIFLHPEGQS